MDDGLKRCRAGCQTIELAGCIHSYGGGCNINEGDDMETRLFFASSYMAHRFFKRDERLYVYRSPIRFYIDNLVSTDEGCHSLLIYDGDSVKVYHYPMLVANMPRFWYRLYILDIKGEKNYDYGFPIPRDVYAKLCCRKYGMSLESGLYMKEATTRHSRQYSTSVPALYSYWSYSDHLYRAAYEDGFVDYFYQLELCELELTFYSYVSRSDVFKRIARRLRRFFNVGD